MPVAVCTSRLSCGKGGKAPIFTPVWDASGASRIIHLNARASSRRPRHWFTMADIFISYSKSDHPLALKLSAFLESEGWSVWWDKSLGAADHYRDEIIKQLAQARAVITIWTERSVHSDWVRAEAGRAKAEGKLIPVKTPELAYADIPIPFGEMHTENISSLDLIRAAIVAQLAKPLVPQSSLRQITGMFKHQVLIWIGIGGTVITVFASASVILDLADWAKDVVRNWDEWTQMLWGWIFSLVQVKVPKVLAPIISFTVFTAMLVAGVNLSVRSGKAAVKSENAVSLARKACIFTGGLILYLGTVLLLVMGIAALEEEVGPLEWAWGVSWWVPIGFQIVYLGYFVKERSWVWIASVLFLFMGGCLVLAPLWQQAGTSSPTELALVFGFAWMVLFQICWMAAILFSPLKQLTRRLIFVVLGVLTLVVLSEISKVNFHQYLRPTTISDTKRLAHFNALLNRCRFNLSRFPVCVSDQPKLYRFI